MEAGSRDPALQDRFATAFVNGRLYLIGGEGASTVDVYDTASDTWSQP